MFKRMTGLDDWKLLHSEDVSKCQESVGHMRTQSYSAHHAMVECKKEVATAHKKIKTLEGQVVRLKAKIKLIEDEF